MEYPGSSRVWRKNETGERGINFIAVDKNITLKFIPLKKAGQYREFEMPLMPDGCAVTELNSAGTGSYDWINVRFSGLIEDESAVKALASELERSHFSHVRKFTSDTEGIDVLAGITGNPLAKRFLDILESKRHLYGRDLFMKMRQIGLKEIKTIIEARK